MAELVREIMIDATPETIWPFLAEPGKHIEWDGTVAEVNAGQFSWPTPCPDFDVKALINHMIDANNLFVEVASGASPGRPVLGDHVDTDAAAAFDPSAAAVIDAWHDPAVQERAAHMPFGDVPGDVALGIHLTESVVHGWDLAKSTGQPTERDPELVAFAWLH